ncbi:EamA family transporter RarD [Megasphaera vaginalis (ex Srinivasan et al. 2021)]|nr:EamA family transporter RarD [Megasphaera vaginalis (ex Srinivasan et al. 2021)]
MKQNTAKVYRIGLMMSITCYLIWGILPLYWNLLYTVSAHEILAHRISWSFIFVLSITLCSNKSQFLADCLLLYHDIKRVLLLCLASILITANWLTYIWAVMHNHIIDTSIGYYLNPLMTVFLGVLFFSEKLSIPKKLSLFLATIGVLIMVLQTGNIPWIAIVLSLTFASYGGVKKKLQLNPFSSITLETLFTLPVATGYLFYIQSIGIGSFGNLTELTSLLLVSSGIVTAVPLILFSYGANLLPLNVLGFIQYISPTLALLLGLFFFKEPLPLETLFALIFIWVSIIIFTLDESKIYRSKKVT